MKKAISRSRMGRRALLKGFAGGAGLLFLRPENALGTAANSKLNVGIIGCGGRGNHVAEDFAKFTESRIVALADAFADPMEGFKSKFGVEAKRAYAGLGAYEELIASPVDAVVITSPPYFHPEQMEAAVNAGKHVWCAKPVAVDVPGAKSIIESGKRAAGKVSVLVDFQTRNSPAFLEVERRIRQGDIGKIVSAQIYYQAGRLGTHADPNDKSPQARLRNWVFDKVLSGDIIVEQNVHVLDVSDWYLNQRPEKAFGTGGRKARVDVGDCWDHFICIFWYPDGTRIDFSSGQYLKGYGDLCMRFYGTLGTADTHYGRSLKITGDKPWEGTEQDNTYREPVIRNAKMFVEGIQNGKLLSNAEQSAESTITTILGRTAAYEERIVTRDEILKADVRLEANLTI